MFIKKLLDIVIYIEPDKEHAYMTKIFFFFEKASKKERKKRSISILLVMKNINAKRVLVLTKIMI